MISYSIKVYNWIAKVHGASVRYQLKKVSEVLQYVL
jgi:hypothetical protein